MSPREVVASPGSPVTSDPSTTLKSTLLLSRSITGSRATFFLSLRASQYWRMRGISASQLGQEMVRLHK